MSVPPSSLHGTGSPRPRGHSTRLSIGGGVGSAAAILAATTSQLQARVAVSQRLGHQLDQLKLARAQAQQERDEEEKEVEAVLQSASRATTPIFTSTDSSETGAPSAPTAVLVSTSDAGDYSRSSSNLSSPTASQGGKKADITTIMLTGVTPTAASRSPPTGERTLQDEGQAHPKGGVHLSPVTQSPCTATPTPDGSQKGGQMSYQPSSLLLPSPQPSDDSAEDVLSESDVANSARATNGQAQAPLAIHSDCRPLRLTESAEEQASQLRSFDAFRRVLRAQNLEDTASSVPPPANTNTPPHTGTTTGDASSDQTNSLDLNARNSVAYRTAPKTLNRLPQLDNGVNKRLKKAKHHRRSSSKLAHEEFARAHPLEEPIHSVDKATLAALIARRKGSGCGDPFGPSSTIARALYDDVCRMLARTNQRLNEREADLQLAGQIGDAILTENGQLEAMVAERSTQLAEALEAQEAHEAKIAELQAQVANLTALNTELLDQSQAAAFDQTVAKQHEGECATSQHSSVGDVGGELTTDTASLSDGPGLSTPHAMRRFDSTDSAYATNVSPSDKASHHHHQLSEALVNMLGEFLATEMGNTSATSALANNKSTTSLSPVNPLSLSSPSSTASPGMPSTLLMSPPSRGEGVPTTSFNVAMPSPSAHAYLTHALSLGPKQFSAFSTGGGGSVSLSQSGATSEMSSALLEDLAALQRKLKKERRHAELERANFQGLLRQSEAELQAHQTRRREAQEEMDQLEAVKAALATTQTQLAQAQTWLAEREVQASVECRLKLQQQRKALDLVASRLEDELKEQRWENEELVRRRNEMHLEVNEMQTTYAQMEAELAATKAALLQAEEEAGFSAAARASLEAQLATHSELTGLLSALRDELECQEKEAQAQVHRLHEENMQLAEEVVALKARLSETTAALSRAELEANAAVQSQIVQLDGVQQAFERKLTALRATHERELRATLRHALEQQEAEMNAEHAVHIAQISKEAQAQLDAVRVEAEAQARAAVVGALASEVAVSPMSPPSSGEDETFGHESASGPPSLPQSPASGFASVKSSPSNASQPAAGLRLEVELVDPLQQHQQHEQEQPIHSPTFDKSPEQQALMTDVLRHLAIEPTSRLETNVTLAPLVEKGARYASMSARGASGSSERFGIALPQTQLKLTPFVATPRNRAGVTKSTSSSSCSTSTGPDQDDGAPRPSRTFDVREFQTICTQTELMRKMQSDGFGAPKPEEPILIEIVIKVEQETPVAPIPAPAPVAVATSSPSVASTPKTTPSPASRAWPMLSPMRGVVLTQTSSPSFSSCAGDPYGFQGMPIIQSTPPKTPAGFHATLAATPKKVATMTPNGKSSNINPIKSAVGDSSSPSSLTSPAAAPFSSQALLPPRVHSGASPTSISSPAHGMQLQPTIAATTSAASGPTASQLEQASQHRLALLSSVGKALSVVTNATPQNARIGSSPPHPIGKSPMPTPSPQVRAAIETARTPSSQMQKGSALAGSAAAAAVADASIYQLPSPPFPISPADQLQLAYHYRFVYAQWVQAFDWLDSCTTAKPALWIEDQISGHCFSCQKHWTVVNRRHHCRLCGGLFCSSCSRSRVDLDKFSLVQVRCCHRCFGATQSMTMSNSLSLWEQKGALQPPPERGWLGLGSTQGTLAADDTRHGVEMLSPRHRASEGGAAQGHSDARHGPSVASSSYLTEQEHDSGNDTDASSDLTDAEYERDMKSIDTGRRHQQRHHRQKN